MYTNHFTAHQNHNIVNYISNFYKGNTFYMRRQIETVYYTKAQGSFSVPVIPFPAHPTRDLHPFFLTTLPLSTCSPQEAQPRRGLALHPSLPVLTN